MTEPRIYTPSFFALFLANVCTVSSFSAFFLFPLFITDRGGTESDIGLIMGTFAFGSVFCRPWISDWVDRLGRKRCYTFGTLGMAIFPLIYLLFDGPLSDFYLTLLLVRLLHGLVLGLCFTAIFTYIADLLPPKRLSEGIGSFGISGLLGMSIGPMLAEWVLHRYSYDGFFLFAAGIAALGLILHQPLPESWQRCATHDEGPSFFRLLCRPKLAIIGGACFLFGFGLASYANFVAPLATERGLTVVSLYYLVYTGGAVGIRIIGARLTDSLGELRVLPVALLIGGTGLACMALVTNQAILLSCAIASGIAHGLIFPALNSLAVRGESAEVRGKVTGIFTGGIDTGLFLGAFILGLIGELAGLNWLFIGAGVAFGLGIPLLFRLKV